MRVASTASSRLATCVHTARDPSEIANAMVCALENSTSMNALNSSDNTVLVQRHALRAMNGTERMVRFTFFVVKVKHYTTLQQFVERGINPILFDVGRGHAFIQTNVYPLNHRHSRVGVEVVVKTRRGFALDTAHDVYLHYVMWLKRGRYCLRNTLTEFTTPVLTHSLIDSDDDEMPPARRLRSLVSHYADKENNFNNDGIKKTPLRCQSLSDTNKLVVAMRTHDDSPGVSRTNSDASPSTSPLPPRRRQQQQPPHARARVQRRFRRHTADFDGRASLNVLNLLV